MHLDGFGLLVRDMGTMIRFYRDVLGFEIREDENTSNVYLIKDGTLFLLYGRDDFEKLTSRKYEYLKGLNGHFEIALYVDTFAQVDEAFRDAVAKGAAPATSPTRKVISSKSVPSTSLLHDILPSNAKHNTLCFAGCAAAAKAT